MIQGVIARAPPPREGPGRLDLHWSGSLRLHAIEERGRSIQGPGLWGQGGYSHHPQFTDKQTETQQVVLPQAPPPRGVEVGLKRRVCSQRPCLTPLAPSSHLGPHLERSRCNTDIGPEVRRCASSLPPSLSPQLPPSIASFLPSRVGTRWGQGEGAGRCHKGPRTFCPLGPIGSFLRGDGFSSSRPWFGVSFSPTPTVCE